MIGYKSSELTAITEQMNQFCINLVQVVNEAGTSTHTLLTLMTKLQKAGKQQFGVLVKRVEKVEMQVGGTGGLPATGTGVVAPSSSVVVGGGGLPAGITADTVFGVGQVGCVNVDLSINALFRLPSQVSRGQGAAAEEVRVMARMDNEGQGSCWSHR